MSKFRIGDKVRVVHVMSHEQDEVTTGRVYLITGFFTDLPVIRNNRGLKWTMCESQLELVKESVMNQYEVEFTVIQKKKVRVTAASWDEVSECIDISEGDILDEEFQGITKMERLER